VCVCRLFNPLNGIVTLRVEFESIFTGCRNTQTKDLVLFLVNASLPWSCPRTRAHTMNENTNRNISHRFGNHKQMRQTTALRSVFLTKTCLLDRGVEVEVLVSCQLVSTVVTKTQQRSNDKVQLTALSWFLSSFWQKRTNCCKTHFCGIHKYLHQIRIYLHHFVELWTLLEKRPFQIRL